MRNLNIILIASFLVFFSCSGKKERVFDINKRRDYSFKVLENLYITTSKCENAQFYVMFSNDSLAVLSDSIDYLKYETAEMSTVNMIFDPNKEKDIFVNNTPYLLEIHPSKFNLNVIKKQKGILAESEFDSMFYEPRIKTEPLILKYPYIEIFIIPSTYHIGMSKYKISQEVIKEGNILGGW